MNIPSPVHRRLFAIALPLALLLCAGPLRADNVRANAALQQGRVDEAQSLLQAALQQKPEDSEAHLLLCRVYYAQDMADESIRECDLAVHGAPADSNSQLWLGRAYGLKAAHANKIVAFRLAKHVSAAFEQAVQLDGGNIHAMSDLGEYYVQAPGIVGGSFEKAEALADKMEGRFPSQAHRLRGLIAKQKNDTTTAESEFKAAVAAGRRPEAYIDLAAFYAEYHRADEAAATVQAAIAADRSKDAILVDAASILTDIHRSPELAARLLREYLASPAKSDAAPAFKVHIQLGRLLAKVGDESGQQAEYATARALASGYRLRVAPEGS